MIPKFSAVLAVGLVPFLAAANPLLVAKADVYYPPGMPSECIPYYTPPTTCSAVPVMPAHPATPVSVPYVPTPVRPTPVYSTSVHSTPVYSTSTSTSSKSKTTPPPAYPTVHSTTPVYSKSKTTPPPASPTVTVTATPPAATHISQCNTGSAQCCNSVQKGSHSSAAGALGLVGAVLSSPDVLVGMGCTPLNVVGVGGVNCAQTPVCCSNNNFNGLVNIGCSPISL